MHKLAHKGARIVHIHAGAVKTGKLNIPSSQLDCCAAIWRILRAS
jgi:hypothetical protein